ncbi:MULTISPECIES: GNAT family N-acetyltransferase [unclassified Streptomyces]|uniref:GNAT family N-acetyltransferase n=1 Tax=unclassified Streptomyces TaxID=2593676 RepID=UPI002253DB29|nr:MULTISPECIES: GNAT family N-acetyltransferase [unclassified Streptomyces]MCX5047269.1 GNAT family N-acetyltransferase [Streptomyces sp. NBC_00474]
MIRANRTVDSLVIRTALAAESAAVAALHVRARSTYYPDGLPDDGHDWPAAWSRAIERPEGQVLCAVRDARLVGIASFRTAEGAPAETVKLFQFHVEPDQWRSGVGTALHAACVEQWQADGRRTAVLDVHVDNERAQAFYARQGWIPDPENPPTPGDPHRYLRYAVPGE